MKVSPLGLALALCGLSPLAAAQSASGWQDAPEDEPSVEAEPSSEPEGVEPAPSPPVESAKPPSRAAPSPRRTAKEEDCNEGCSWRRHHFRHEHAFTLSAGFANLRVDGLDDRLGGAGYAPLSDRAYNIGLGGTSVVGDGLVLGLGGTYTRNRQSGGPADARVHADMAELHALIGVALGGGDRWLIYPAFLIGGYRLGLEVDGNDGAGFDSVVASPSRQVELHESGVEVGGVLAIDRRFFWRRDPHRFTSLGLRVGVLRAVTAGSWRAGDRAAPDGPDALPRVQFVAIALGFGRR